jgi:hypothetical protein|tara:strand:+ start:759 stop:875 length:117 start_codon:yes stop_codon:yes gene_type:complete
VNYELYNSIDMPDLSEGVNFVVSKGSKVMKEKRDKKSG